MHILVAAADGPAGRAIVRQLAERGAQVSGLVSSEAARSDLAQMGAQAFVGDLRDPATLKAAMADADRVYHICPAWRADEREVGEAVIAAARASGIELIGYHSVMAPHLKDVPSHWAKMQVQMALMQGGVPFSVVQPAPYLQTLDAALAAAATTGMLATPFEPDAVQPWVDGEDVGEAVALLMTWPDQLGGTYELCGAEQASPSDIAALAAQAVGRPVAATTVSPEVFVSTCGDAAADLARRERFAAYCGFVNRYGMRVGNSRVLSMLLGRPPATLADYVTRRLRGD